MRIAFLTWRDTGHPDGGGSEVFVEEVARRLAARGHQVTVVCARSFGQAGEEHLDGVRYLRRGGRLGVYPTALAWVTRHRRRIDVVVDVVNGLPFWTPLLRRRGTVALLHHVHREQWHIIYPRFWGAVGWFVEGRVMPRVYRRTPFVTVSASSRQDLIRLGLFPDRISVARNGLATSERRVSKSPTPRLVTLGRLVPHKQFDHALWLVAELTPALPDLRLDVIGEGWWGEQLRAEAQRLGVADRVTFHGQVPARRRDELLAVGWLMVLPSVKEGWGLAIVEAAAQGTPTVAYSAAGGVAEAIVDGATGWLVDDRNELLELVRTVLADPELARARGEQARARARTFSWEATTDVVERALAQAADHATDQGTPIRGYPYVARDADTSEDLTQ